MKIFQKFKILADFRRRYMPFVERLEDLDLLWEIGLYQEAGTPIALKVLYLKGIGSVATIQRRLSRLKRLGVVCQSRADHDKRVVRLTVNPALLRKFHRLFALFK